MKKHQILAVTIVTGALAVFNTACGSNSGLDFVKGAQLKTYQQNSASYTEIDATLSTGSFSLPSVNLPIPDPLDLTVNVGTLTINPDIDGSSTDLGIAVNLTSIAGIPGTMATLPNGQPLPIGGLGGAAIELPVAQTAARIYLAFGQNSFLIGTAIPIDQFNGIGGTVGGASLFLPFNFGSGISGTAGVFTSPQAGGNGFALFVTATGLGQNPPSPTPSPSPSPASRVASQAFASVRMMAVAPDAPVAAYVVSPQPLQPLEVHPDSRKESRIRNRIYQMQVSGDDCCSITRN